MHGIADLFCVLIVMISSCVLELFWPGFDDEDTG